MIDIEIQAGLRCRFNPDGSLLRRHQLKLLEMLKFIDKVCRSNDIPYWLSSGTLIGAMRHGGFIPWDDDVDVEMLATDFPRFQEAVERVGDPRYVVQTTANDPEFLFAFGKLRDLNSLVEESNGLDSLLKYRGCYIDVFTIAPSSSRKLHRLGCKLVGTELKCGKVAGGVAQQIAAPGAAWCRFSGDEGGEPDRCARTNASCDAELLFCTTADVGAIACERGRF